MIVGSPSRGSNTYAYRWTITKPDMYVTAPSKPVYSEPQTSTASRSCSAIASRTSR